MTNIQISEEATKNIETVIGTRDPKTVGAFFERFTDQEPLLQAVMVDGLSDEDVHAVQDGIGGYEAGQVTPLAEFDAAVRKRNGIHARDRL